MPSFNIGFSCFYRDPGIQTTRRNLMIGRPVATLGRAMLRHGRFVVFVPRILCAIAVGCEEPPRGVAKLGMHGNPVALMALIMLREQH